MKRLIYGFVAGLTLLASTALAKDIDIFVRRSGDHGVIQVANKESLEKNYKGDVFFDYRKLHNKWVLDKITHLGQGRILREYIRDVTEIEVPTYVDGICSLYYDSDQDEESLVAVFEDNVDSKVKEAWIELAKKHVKELNES